MPSEQSRPPATATTRRSFLTRTAGLGALASAVTLGSPAHALLDAAGAAEAAGSQSSTELSDADFAAFTAPLELAAVQAYQAALDSSAIGRSASSMVQKFQDHHQTVADTLTTLLSADADPPLPATAFSNPIVSSISFAGSEPDILRTLAAMENTLSATHLMALETLTEPVTAKVVAQVLASEAQQATALGNSAGDDVTLITPATGSSAGGLQPGDVVGAPPAKKESTGGDGSGSDGSGGTGSGGGNTGGTGSGGDTSSGNGTDSNSGSGSTDSSGSGDGSGGSGSSDSTGSGDSGSSSGSGATGSGSSSGT